MYNIPMFSKDKLVFLEEIPKPCYYNNTKEHLSVIFNNNCLYILYEKLEPKKTSGNININSVHKKSFVVLLFEYEIAHYFYKTYPNFRCGHPLKNKGNLLAGYSYKVEHSSWIAQTKKTHLFDNHGMSDGRLAEKDYYDDMNHYIITFDDYFFECLAKRYELRVVFADKKKILQEVLNESNDTSCVSIDESPYFKNLASN